MSIILGLTGPTGAGKSTITDLAKRRGITVIDCDFYARKATERSSAGLRALTQAFSDSILDENGELNRKHLAKIAFSSKENTILLNRTLLPHIERLVIEQMKGDKIILDAPTLFESGMNKRCSVTAAVLAPVEQRLKRIMQRDNISKEDALLRINAGKSDEFFKNNVDFVIYNDNNEENFLMLAQELLDKIFGGNENE